MLAAMKAVIFDMDGVLIDSEPIHIRLEEEMFAELGLHLSAEEHAGFLGCSGRDMFAILKDRYKLERSVDSLLEEERRRYMDRLRSMPLPLVEGVTQLVRDLSEAGFRMAVASSAPHEQINLVLEKGGLADFFRHRMSGDDVPESKPNPEIFLRAAALLDVPPEECWVIEDSPNGVTAALKAGMQSIGFLNPSSGDQNLSEAHFRISRLADAAEIMIGRG